MQGHAVINLRAGTVLGLSAEEVADIVRRGFAEAGHDIDVRLVPPERLSATLEDLAKAPGDVLLVGGGDGTVRTAAACLVDGDKALGVIPLGTLNRYARDLGIPLDLREAVTALAAGDVVRVDCAEVHDSLFLCNSTLGLPARFSTERQRLRGRSLRERITGYWHALRSALRARHRMALSIDDHNGTPRVVRVLSLAISNNPYGQESSLLLSRPRLDTGELGVYISRHRSGAQMAMAMVRVMGGLWDGDPYLDISTARSVTVDSTRPLLHLVNDGEVEKLKPPLVYRIRPGALAVLRPGEVQ